MEKKNYFDILQIYRGIAALLVVIHHTYISFEYYHDLDIPLLKFIVEIGKYGVDFFFVLSGFIITYTTANYVDNPKYSKKYILNRILRIYVPYLPVGLGIFIIYMIFPGLSNSDREISWITSFTLLPHGNPALSVAWTLTFEMFFYSVFLLNFLSKKLFLGLLPLWTISIILINIFGINTHYKIFEIVFNWYNLEFILGVMVAYLAKKLTFFKYRYVFGSALLFVFLFTYLKYFHIQFFEFSLNILFALAASLFVFMGVRFWNFKINSKNIMMLIGNSSYSLYLLHDPIQSVLVRIIPKKSIQLMLLFELFVVIMLCCLTSYFYHIIFEKKLLVFLKKQMKI
ncbi:acyltransferase [Kaistella sp. PBT33-4]|uniref:acyltransferase family protein n=1 Tax=Kaistella sp. PBT33-4 TaxID=3032000 RepID=UPI0023D87C52|nr:acyltransferase [Kaistella sp. PBT33-4]MDF0718786.1 acyltransferase [Kaistella sp. PBT33-4]